MTGTGTAGGNKYFRKVLTVTAWDSPNVRLAEEEIKQGKEPSHTIVVPGVLTYAELLQRLATWDEIRQVVGLCARFYDGPGILLFPAAALSRAHQIADRLKGTIRHAEAIGVDPAEGGDKSAWSVVDRLGLIYQESLKTPDTTFIPNRTLALMREYNVPAEKVMFDRGGGGKEHADWLRSRGHKVQTMAFGESVVPPPKRRGVGGTMDSKTQEREERYTYVNRRAMIAHTVSLLLDLKNEGFGIPREYAELTRQMSLLPKLYDPEGRIKMLPKDKKGKRSDEQTLVELLGHSPDEFDSLCCAVYSLTSKTMRPVAGAA